MGGGQHARRGYKGSVARRQVGALRQAGRQANYCDVGRQERWADQPIDNSMPDWDWWPRGVRRSGSGPDVRGLWGVRVLGSCEICDRPLHLGI